MNPPEHLEEFLVWFREETEKTWRHYCSQTLAQQKIGGVGGRDWQAGTKWTAGLTNAEILRLEEIEGRPFPDEYSSFLSILGTPNKKEIRFSFEGSEMVQGECSSFPNWKDPEDIAARRNDFLESILFDVHHGIWLDFWGAEPEGMSAKVAHVTSLVNQAPPLLPIWLHRAIPSVQCDHPLPVLSIYQTDAIIYALSIREALLRDFGYLVGVPTCDHATGGLTLPAEFGFWRNMTT